MPRIGFLSPANFLPQKRTSFISLMGNAPTTSTARRAFTSSIISRDASEDVNITDRLSMKGKTVLVTGGGRGIGFAVCKAIAQLGGNIAVLDALEAPNEDLRSLSTEYGTKAIYERVDVTIQSSLEAGFNSIVEQVGSIEGCVTAAGIVADKPFTEHGWDECQRMLNVNVLGTFWTARLVAKNMIARKQGGSIVMIASVAGQGIKLPMQDTAIYSMSKAAVKGVVGPLAVELGGHGIRVNSISPGIISTPMIQALESGSAYPELVNFFHKGAPLRRIGQTSDLTPVVAYLLSDASGFTTGSDIVVSGGLHAGLSPEWVERK